jgi:hypothetical protein
MLDEIDDRIAHGVGVLAEEKNACCGTICRSGTGCAPGRALGGTGLLWWRLPHTNAWGELAGLFNTGEPFEAMARTYIHPILNRGTGAKLQTMRRMIAEYQLDGVILHSDRSCKPYSVGQMDQRDRLIREDGIPALLVEADHNDPRAFAEEQVANRLQAFVEMLGV